ncbi:MAG: hypothetical protein HUJ27_13475 [Rhodobacteraceae bacterium]|nr:hypothetical protein [Paracoccaceae bacterium]
MQDSTLRTFRGLTILSLVLALANHLLPPTQYSATQLLVTYDGGFVRRGMGGELLSLVLPDRVRIPEIYLAAFMITLAGAASFYVALFARMRGSLTTMLLMLIALNSFAFSSFVGSTGYLDGLLMVLAATALASPSEANWGLAMRVALLLFGALIHEVMVPYFMMLIALDIWLAEEGRRRWRAALPVVAGCSAVILLFTLGDVTPEISAKIVENVRARAAFAPHEGGLQTIAFSMTDHLAFAEQHRAHASHNTMLLFDGVPLGAMVLWIWWLGTRLLGDGQAGARLIFLLVLLAPLSLNMVAVDVARFFCAAALSGFLALGLILVRVPGARARLAETLTLGHALAVLVLSSNLFTYEFNSGTGYMAQAPWIWFEQGAWFAAGDSGRGQ